MRKVFIFLTAMLSIGLSIRVSADCIKFSTSLYDGDVISFIIRGDNCWIDLNGNEKKDPGEEIDGSTNTVQLKTLNKTTNVSVHGDNITKFSCRKKELTELNLYAAKNLRELFCPGNDLKVLDLSENHELVSLNCSANALTRLDLSLCKKIEELNCAENAVTQLILPKAEALTDLDCYSNKLRILDLGECSAIERLDCSDNELANLKLGSVSSIKSLLCENNKLQTIDISFLKNLTTLDCSNNGLSALSLLANVNLQDIDCSVNKLSFLDVKLCGKLSTLKVFRNEIGYNEMDKLIDGLNNAEGEKTVTVIDSSTSEDGEQNSCSKASVAKARSKGWIVYDRKGGLADGENSYDGTDGPLPEEEIAFITARTAGEKIELTVTGENCWIDLNANGCKDDDEAIRNGIPETKLINGKADLLRIYGCNITAFTCQGQKISFINTSKAPKLTSLSCFQNRITQLDLGNNTELTSLICSGNDLTELKVGNLSKLTLLNCSVNKLESIDITSLIMLKELDCSANKLLNIDVSCNTALISFSCDNNKLTELDLKANENIRELSCFVNAVVGEKMSNMIASLPSVTTGSLFVTDTKSKTEGNLCLVSDVTAAKAKGWIAYDFRGGINKGQNPYPGSENAATNECIVFSTDLASGKTISLTLEAEDSWIDLNGNRQIDEGEALAGDWNSAEEKVLDKTTGIAIYGKKITRLIIARNELTDIDIAKAPELLRLDCNENKLTELRLSHPNKIEKLNCYENKLTLLDLTGAVELRSLFCNKNELTSVDMNKCVKLSCVSFSNNNVASVDISSLTNLDSLYCVHNKLFSLDASECKKLTLLSCFDNRLSNGAVTKLISTLPDEKSAANKVKTLFIIDTKNPREQNVCTTPDVEAAIAKGWIVYDFKGGANAGRNPYAGTTHVNLVERLPGIIISQSGNTLLLTAQTPLSTNIEVYDISGKLLYRGLLNEPKRLDIANTVLLIKSDKKITKVSL